MRIDPYKRKTLTLFFIISFVPALIVAAVWYFYSQTDNPVFLVGILPAVALSFVFAELLTEPVRRIHMAVIELSRGNYKQQFRTHGNDEFSEIGAALDIVASQLERTLSEAASETALIAAERGKLRSVLGAMTDGVFALDRSGRIVLFNQAASRLTGRSMEEVAGQLAEKVLPFRSQGQLVMTRWLATQTGQDKKTGEWKGLELYSADGTSLYVDVQAIMLTDDPNGIATLVTFHDITKGRQLDEMKIDFVALAAHELRTPLTEVEGYLDILSSEAKGLSKSNKDLLDHAMSSANQLSGLVHNLLNVARIEHDELGYHPEPMDYLAFIHSVCEDLTVRAKRLNRQLKLVLPVRLPPFAGDTPELTEIIVNLVENALAYTSPKTGVITISVRHQHDSIETSVSDNGRGIPASAVPHLFTKFFRADEMHSVTRGTGLGLFICRSIVEAHGGYIWVDSTEGKGSTFTFRLPIKPIAKNRKNNDNDATSITREAHGWIKNNPIR